MKQIKLVLKPGQHGTKKWMDKYGDKLVSVRYRYDEKRRKRYKTVEIIVEEECWKPGDKTVKIQWNPSDKLGIRVAGYEMEVREKVKKAGGIWRPRQKLWELSYAKIVALGLENRIITDQRD